MALIAPVGAKSFYEDGLLGLKAALEQVNGSSSGRLTVIHALPANIDSGSWAVVGAGGDGITGTAVLGYADLQAISTVVAGEEEEAGENGWKLTFDPVDDVPINIANTAIAIALVVGRDTFAGGSDLDVRYIVDLTNLPVAELTSINVPTWDIEVQFATNAP